MTNQINQKPSLNQLKEYVADLEKHNWFYARLSNHTDFLHAKANHEMLVAKSVQHYLYGKAFDIQKQYVNFFDPCVDREHRKSSAITSLYAEQMVSR